MPLSSSAQIRRFYRALFRAWGRQHWWPAQSRFEVIAGAYLTQNTAWSNVERALSALRGAGVLSIEGIRALPLPELEKLIRPAGYFRQKARRLKTFIEFLDARYGGSLDRMFTQPTEVLREQLLALNGVGPETADSILLYAGNHPVFVVDAYTRRIVSRHEIVAEDAPYEEIRELFERALRRRGFLDSVSRMCQKGADEPYQQNTPTLAKTGPGRGARRAASVVRPEGSCHEPSPMSTARRTPLAQVFNEMHGLIVGVGKNYCVKSKPRCQECPLGKLLPQAAEGLQKARPPQS